MKGFILAAGIGSRLKPWTDSHPKALVPVGGRPIISYVVDKMLAVGIDTIVVNVHHFASQITEYLRRAYPEVDIRFSDETQLLLNHGGGLRKALRLIGNDDVLIHNADILSTIDLNDFIAQFHISQADALLLTQHRNTQRYLLFNKSRLDGWTNIATGETRPDNLDATPEKYDFQAFAGIHIIRSSLFKGLLDYAPDNEPFSIIDFYIDHCRQAQIHRMELPAEATWFDVGKPDTLDKARQFFDHKA